MTHRGGTAGFNQVRLIPTIITRNMTFTKVSLSSANDSCISVVVTLQQRAMETWIISRFEEALRSINLATVRASPFLPRDA